MKPRNGYREDCDVEIDGPILANGRTMLIRFQCRAEWEDAEPTESLTAGWSTEEPYRATVGPERDIVPVDVAIVLALIGDGGRPDDPEAWRKMLTRIREEATESAQREHDVRAEENEDD